MLDSDFNPVNSYYVRIHQDSFMMKKTILLLILPVLCSCATITGGSKYYAHISVKDHPDALISQAGVPVGVGQAIVKQSRSRPGKLPITISEEGCIEQHVLFKDPVFRGWSFAASVVLGTGFTRQGFPIPWAPAIDLASGAVWKPSTKDGSVVKIDNNNFSYEIQYLGCEMQLAD